MMQERGLSQRAARTETDRGIIEGLLSKPRTIDPKYFYDERGSSLYDRICATPEYYPTRTELSILRQNARLLADLAEQSGAWIELGAGAVEKSSVVLSLIRGAVRFIPIDISIERLWQSTEALLSINRRIQPHPVRADFTQLARTPLDIQGTVFFPGSTIGNFEPSRAQELLQSMRPLVSIGPGGTLAIGVDLIKDRAILERAYNDSSGYTAAFNLNLLERIKRELKAQIDVNGFKHRAFYNESKHRIEMHLEAIRPVSLEILNHRIVLEKGESIHTESSYKYSLASFATLARGAGYRVAEILTDTRGWFAIFLLQLNGIPKVI